MGNQNLSKKVKRAKKPMAVTKAGHKSNAVHTPKPKQVVVLSIATKADMGKFFKASSVDEKTLPSSVLAELEAIFMKGR